MNFILWAVFILAALLEVGGDAAIRFGLRHGGLVFIVLGVITLGCYGLVVNIPTKIDFSKLMGAYIAVFALVSLLTGRFVFKETIPMSTWFGLALILAGGAIIQFRR